jgi:hypothetical protein
MYDFNPKYNRSDEDISRDRLDSLKQRLSRQGIDFRYSFDSAAHDRYLETQDWRIILGRGLDIFHPPERGAVGRRVRGCNIIYLPTET